MNNKLAIIAIFSISYALGMQTTSMQRIDLEGTMILPDCDYHLAGFASEAIQTKTNKMLGKDFLQENDICIPVTILVKDFTPGHKAIDRMLPGSEKCNIAKELLKIKARPMIVFPAYKLQNNGDLTVNIGKKFSVLCRFSEHNELQDTIEILNTDKPSHIFVHKKETTSDMFDMHISRRIFALEADGLTKPSKKLNHLLEKKERKLIKLLRQREFIRQAGQNDDDITEKISDLNNTSVFDFYNIPQYQQLCSFGGNDTSVVTFEVPHFLNSNLEGSIRSRHMTDFKGKQQENMLHVIQNRETGFKKF